MPYIAIGTKNGQPHPWGIGNTSDEAFADAATREGSDASWFLTIDMELDAEQLRSLVESGAITFGVEGDVTFSSVPA